MCAPARRLAAALSSASLLVVLSLGGNRAFAAVHSQGGGGENVLILIADDLGVDQLDIYGLGKDLPRTPVLDSLAAQGVSFAHCWADPVCSPTRAGMMTGRYGFRTGIQDVVRVIDPGLPADEIPLPEALDRNPALGYQSALFGKWHLGSFRNAGESSPNAAGWDHYSGSLVGSLAPPQDYYAWRRTEDGRTAWFRGYATSDTVDQALAWVSSQSGPWVCWVAFNAPHAPYELPPRSLLPDPDGPLSALSTSGGEREVFKSMVEALDHEIGRLLDGLDPAVRIRTTVVFVGDNGTAPAVVVPPFDPQRSKGTLYQGGVRVPLIIVGPEVRQPGSWCSALVNTTDLYATVLEIAGADPGSTLPAGRELDSLSLLPYLRNPFRTSRREFLYAGYHASGPARAGNGWALRDRRYKLILFPRRPPELYDLWRDPREGNELIRSGPLDSDAAQHYDALMAEFQELLGLPPGSR